MTRFLVVPSLLVLAVAHGSSIPAQTTSLLVAHPGGLQLLALPTAAEPTVRVVLPGRATSDRSIEVRVPEHVTAVRRGSTTAEHLFLPAAGSTGNAVSWQANGRALEYERELPGSIQFVARAILEN